MKSFDEVWQFTEKIPGSFTGLSGEKLYECAMAVPHCGLVVEVGVDQGRSASLLLKASEHTKASVFLIDSWESVLIDNMAKVANLLTKFWRVDALIINGKSVEVAKTFDYGPIDLIHIDANHYKPNPAQDCEAWLPKLKFGGVACFHDYDSTFHAVKEAVDKYTEGWQHLGNWDSLAIRRKP